MKKEKDCNPLAETGLCLIDPSDAVIEYYTNCEKCSTPILSESIEQVYTKIGNKHNTKTQYIPVSTTRMYTCACCGHISLISNEVLHKDGEQIIYEGTEIPKESFLEANGFTKLDIDCIYEFAEKVGNIYESYKSSKEVVGYVVTKARSLEYKLEDYKWTIPFKKAHKWEIQEIIRKLRDAEKIPEGEYCHVITAEQRAINSGLFDENNKEDVFKHLLNINYPRFVEDVTDTQIKDFSKRFHRHLEDTLTKGKLKTILPRTSKNIAKNFYSRLMINGFHPEYCTEFNRWIKSEGLPVLVCQDNYRILKSIQE